MIKPINLPATYRKKLPELKKIFERFILNGEYIGGVFVANFEKQIKKYLKADYVIGCKSGTHALQLALLAAGIKEGDEVITVGNTYYATVYAIKSIGAKPVFCDVLEENGLIDPESVRLKITKKTKAVIPVHLYGMQVDLINLKKICKKNKLIIIEDCSHAFGSKYKKNFIGSKSEFACFSLYPTKNLGAFGDAGMVTTKSKKYANRIHEILYLYDKKRKIFDPKAIHAMLDPLQAALLSFNLKNFSENKEKRKILSGIYKKKLKKYVRLLPESKNVNYYIFPIFIKKRNELLKFLLKKNVNLQVHYKTNLHCLSQFGGLKLGTLPNTEKHNKEVVSLPVHPSVSISEAEFICDSIIEFFKNI